MDPARGCPDCSTPMRTLQRAAQTHRPTLEWCAECGGLWFAAGHLSKLLGQPVAEEPFDAMAERQCTECALELATVMLKGSVPAERCGGCGGLFLDHGELTELGGADPPLLRSRPPAAERRATSAGFDCVRCGKRFPFAEGNVLRSGLACRSCTPTPLAPPGGKASASPKPVGMGAVDVLSVLVDLLTLLS